MIATPVFAAPIGDLLTRDRVRSSRDSDIISSRGPLWMAVVKPPDIRRRYIAEAVADDMGIIIRMKGLTFLREPSGSSDREYIRDIGGTADVIWLATSRFRAPPDVEYSLEEGRIYELSPIDFAVRRQELVSPTRGLLGVDGDTETLYVGTSLAVAGRRSLWKLDAMTLSVIASRILPAARRAITIAGDTDRCWIGDRVYGEIKEYTSDLEFVRTLPYPFAGIGHGAQHIGGGSQRIYCTTTAGEDVSGWRLGTYMHTIRPAEFTVARMYGPWISGRIGAYVGGK